MSAIVNPRAGWTLPPVSTAGAALVVFAADAAIPHTSAISVLYVPLVLAVLIEPRGGSLRATTLLCCALCLVGGVINIAWGMPVAAVLFIRAVLIATMPAVAWVGTRPLETQSASFLVHNPLATHDDCRGEDEVRTQDDLIRFLLDSTSEAVYGIDTHGRCTFCNRACLDMLGYTSAEQVLGANMHELIHHTQNDGMPHDVAECHIFRAVRENRGVRIDTEVLWRADGTSFPAEYSSVPIRRRKKTVGAVVTFVDITERIAAVERLQRINARLEQKVAARTAKLKETIEALRIRESRLSAYYEQNLVGMCVTSPQTEWIEVNDRLVDMLGYPREELMRLTWKELTHPDDVGADLDQFTRLMEGEIDHYELEKRYRHADGSLLPALLAVRCRRGEHGQVIEVCATVVDLRNIKAVEAELARTSTRLSRVIASAHEAFVSMDETGCITGWNKSAEDIFGWTGEEVVGKSLAEYIIPERFRDLHRAGISQYLKTGHGPVLGRLLELTALHRDGHEFPIELSLGAIELDGQVEFTSFLRDISDRKAMEEESREYAERLQQSNQDLEQFAYVASHDLKEPLRAVSGFCQLLEMEFADQLNEEGQGYIRRAINGAERMQQLINDLLEFSRVNRQGKLFRSIDLNEVCEDVLLGLGALILETGAQIDVSPLPTVEADRSQITRVFQNLIQNALKYRRDRTPHIQISARDQLSTNPADNHWTISVEDNGIGIDDEFHDRVFVIFQRLHTRDEYDGNGFGLSICQRIVQRHGGRIWVESKAGEGSKFRFTLPHLPQPVLLDMQESA